MNRPLASMSALRSTLILTGVSLFSQAVGFVYRVLLSRMVGSEILGLYQLVIPVYAVLLSLTGIGFTAAGANLSSRWKALHNKKAEQQTVQGCILGFLLSFLPVAVLVLLFSDPISVYLLGDARSRLGLLLLLPCTLLTGLENIHKHYFYGVGNIRPPALSETFEHLFRAVAVLGLLWYFIPRTHPGPEKVVGLIILGMTLCEICSVLILTTLFRRFMGAHPAGPGVPQAVLRKQIRMIALPVGFTALLGNLMGAATSVMIPQRLVRTGSDVSQAMSAFGVLCGMTVPLLSLPTAVISAMSLILVPKLAESTALGKPALSRRRLERALNASAALVFPACALLAVLAPALGQVLFRDDRAGAFSLPLSLAVILSCFEGVLHAALNGLGRQREAARCSLICGAVQLGITWFRMGSPGVGLRGYVEGLLLSTLLGVWLNFQTIRRRTDLRLNFSLFRWVIAPGLAALLSALCARLILLRLTDGGVRQDLAGLIALCLGSAVALCALSAQGILTLPKRKRADSP